MTSGAEGYQVVVAAGTLRASDDDESVVRYRHPWTDDGVTAAADFTGAHVLHLAVAGCVLNDLYREAAARGIRLDGVRIVAKGGFEADTWHSTGVTYAVEVDSAAATDDLAQLVHDVDDVAEIPRALRAGMPVRRGL
jgi:uncharacterized OsmC-like protein